MKDNFKIKYKNTGINGVLYSSSQTKFHENTWANHVNYLRSEVIDYHCHCMSLKLNSAHINIYFKLMILFPLELHLLWKHRVFTSYFMISGNSQMSLFRHFTLWAPTCFPEAICLRYGPGYFISACFLATEVNICYGRNFPKRKYH